MVQIVKVNGEIVNPFLTVGFIKIAESGKSFRIEINRPDTTFTHVYYVSREHVRQTDTGHRKEAMVHMLREKDKQDPDYKDE